MDPVDPAGGAAPAAGGAAPAAGGAAPAAGGAAPAAGGAVAVTPAPAPEGTARAGSPTWQQAFSLVAIGVWVGSFILIQSTQIPQTVIISASLGTIALLTFVAFYSATGTEGMRTAIAATLVVFYLVLITHLIAAPNFRTSLDTATQAGAAASAAPTSEAAPSPSQGPTASAAPAEAAAAPTTATSFGRDIFNGLTEFVKIVLLFYFTAVTAEKVVATVTSASQNRTSMEAAAQTGAATKQAEAANTELAAANANLEAAKIRARPAPGAPPDGQPNA
jgi:hypothetical protein